MVKLTSADIHILEKLMSLGYMYHFSSASEVLACRDTYWLEIWAWFSKDTDILISTELIQESVNGKDVNIIVYVGNEETIKVTETDDPEIGIAFAIRYLIEERFDTVKQHIKKKEIKRNKIQLCQLLHYMHPAQQSSTNFQKMKSEIM